MSQLDTLDLHMLRVRGHDDAADEIERLRTELTAARSLADDRLVMINADRDEVRRLKSMVLKMQDTAHGREAIDKLNTDQMQRDTKLIERLRTDVALLRDALDALQDATSHIPGHHGPDVWRVVESARQALEKTKP